eukprot:TRINITY_DN83_c1_g1_i9.p3 TRINITY_DN83_c1_g1~~TRINITY_DN83_c1_g1_i9.p3  ORF type:complete len:269 (+),score=146.66 TRINITY_DN83_c1_g1_i9:65-871(+)
MKIADAVYVVTGGASGLGEAVVRNAVANGGKVAIWDMNQKKGNALVEELGAAKVGFFKVDVSSEASVNEALAKTVEQFGKVNVVVNSAGVAGASLAVNRKGDPHSLKAYERIIRINLIGTFLVATRCAAQMCKQEPNAEGERGVIVNFASVAAFDGQNGQLAYSASKAGVVGMALPMARDLGDRGVRINTVAPGVFDTPMGGAKKPVDNRDASKMNKVQGSLLSSQLYPNTRFGRPAELAKVVQCIVEVPMINAEVIRVDAGTRMPKL